MRIKGSELRRIIKEEISRSRRLSEAGGEVVFDEPAKVTEKMGTLETPPSADNVAHDFVSAFAKMVRFRANNPLKDTVDEYSTISFSGHVDSATDYGHAFGPSYIFEYDELTVDGKPMPQSVLSELNTKIGPKGITHRVRPGIVFTAQFNLGDLYKEQDPVAAKLGFPHPEGQTVDLNILDVDSGEQSSLSDFISKFVKIDFV